MTNAAFGKLGNPKHTVAAIENCFAHYAYLPSQNNLAEPTFEHKTLK